MFVALGIQQAMRMHRSVICGISGSNIIFSTLSHKRNDFRKIIIEHKMCVLIFSTTFVWNISHYRKNWVKYDQKCLLSFMWSTRYSCQCNETLISSTYFRKKKILRYQDSWKSVQWELSCFMRIDGQAVRHRGTRDGADARFFRFGESA